MTATIRGADVARRRAALAADNARRTRRDEIASEAFPPEAIDATFRLFHAALARWLTPAKVGYSVFQFARGSASARLASSRSRRSRAAADSSRTVIAHGFPATRPRR